MGDDKKKLTPRREFFRKPQWWLTFIVMNGIMALLKFRFLSSEVFVIVFDIMIILALILQLIEISHQRTFGDRLFETYIIVVLTWILISVFALPERWNFLIP